MSLLYEENLKDHSLWEGAEIKKEEVPLVLEHYMLELNDMMDEIKELIEKLPEGIRDRALSYWYESIRYYIGTEGKSEGYTLRDTLTELEAGSYSEESTAAGSYNG